MLVDKAFVQAVPIHFCILHFFGKTVDQIMYKRACFAKIVACIFFFGNV